MLMKPFHDNKHCDLHRHNHLHVREWNMMEQTGCKQFQRRGSLDGVRQNAAEIMFDYRRVGKSTEALHTLRLPDASIGRL